MTIRIDIPDQTGDEIGDETAARIVDFLYRLGDAIGTRYDGQIRRFHLCRRHYPPRQRPSSRRPAAVTETVRKNWNNVRNPRTSPSK